MNGKRLLGIFVLFLTGCACFFIAQSGLEGFSIEQASESTRVGLATMFIVGYLGGAGSLVGMYLILPSRQ
jgi:hypothetical protein